YTTGTKNPLRVSYNYLTAEDVSEVERYFKQQMADNVKTIEAKEKKLLNFRAYEILNYKLDDINKMDSDAIDRINLQIYDFFKIRENAINKEYLLEKAIDEYDRERNKITSGNGYVDILLIMGVIGTAIMVVSILTFIVF
ncbi:MAG: hypothetical protein K2M17_01945, partial [Bacilli bacterium]|nr:hypothetical protein [Bacilli bacterium]